MSTNPAREALTRAVNRAIAEGAPVYTNISAEDEEKSFYAERVTTLYVAPSTDDAIVVHEVTLEPKRRENGECVDFDTLAWCPDAESAERIAKALNVLAQLEEWREGDVKERTANDILRELLDD